MVVKRAETGNKKIFSSFSFYSCDYLSSALTIILLSGSVLEFSFKNKYFFSKILRKKL